MTTRSKKTIQSRSTLPYRRIHCVGIGGMGLSALARLFVESGAVVSGTDRHATRGTEALKKLKVPIAIGEYAAHNLPEDVDLVVYTKDEEQTNPEVQLARKRKITLKSYPQAIPIAFGRRDIIGIAGTHGKTTTTGMIGSALVQAGLDPSIAVGSWFSFLNGNARLGQGRFAVFEADEYKRAFLHHVPTVAVVTNIEAEHLNYFKNFDDVFAAFSAYAARLPRHGALIACADDPGARRLGLAHHGCTILYGLDRQADLRATNITLSGPESRFTATYQGEPLGTFTLRVPGLHNVRNALAAIAAASYAGVPAQALQKSLKEFPGAWRRFEFKGHIRGITVIDDFAHHPTELQATLHAARDRFGKRRIVAVFQPHFYGRLRDFFKEFVQALQIADRVIVPPVYFVEGREDDPTVAELYNSERLAREVKRKGTSAVATPDLQAAATAAVAGSRKGDVILTIGAGTVTELGPKILKSLV